jgi:hypothetical protein
LPEIGKKYHREGKAGNRKIQGKDRKIAGAIHGEGSKLGMVTRLGRDKVREKGKAKASAIPTFQFNLK